jgi:hypothetical protein
LLVSRYDADGDGKLSFWEFSNIFMPIKPELRQVIEARNSRPVE